MKRRGLTTKDIFEKRKYWNIYYLIRTQQKKNIKFTHLRAVLCINPGLSKDKVKQALGFFIDDSQKSKDYIKFLQNANKKGEIANQDLKKIVASVEGGVLYDMASHGWLNNENKFNSFQALGNAISRMHKLGLIITVPDTKGHGFYILTENGYLDFLKYQIHWYLDNESISKEKLVKMYEETIH